MGCAPLLFPRGSGLDRLYSQVSSQRSGVHLVTVRGGRPLGRPSPAVGDQCSTLTDVDGNTNPWTQQFRSSLSNGLRGIEFQLTYSNFEQIDGLPPCPVRPNRTGCRRVIFTRQPWPPPNRAPSPARRRGDRAYRTVGPSNDSSLVHRRIQTGRMRERARL